MEDFVIATGKKTSVRDFVKFAAEAADIEIIWEGEGIDEKGYEKTSGKVIIEVDPQFFRPAEVEILCGDASKAKNKLGWEAKTDVKALAKIMVQFDLSKKLNF